MPGKNNGEKSTNAEKEIYINQIAHLLIRGLRRRSEILQYVSRMDSLSKEKQQEVGWIKIGKSTRIIDEYVKKAKETLEEINKDTLGETITLYLCQLEGLFREAWKKGHYQTANNIMKNKMYLKGIGGFNIRGKFDVSSFDVPLTDEENNEYKKRLKEFLGDGFIDMIDE